MVYSKLLRLLTGSTLGILCTASLFAAPQSPHTDTFLIRSRGDTIRSGCEYDYPPYCTVSPEGEAGGFSVELLNATLGSMGYHVSYTTNVWAKVKQSLIDGESEVLPLVGRTPEREGLFDFTIPYLPMHGSIFVHEENTTIHALSDLSGKQIAVMKADNAEEFVRRSNLGATIITTTSFDEALLGLSQKKYDAVIIQKLVGLQLLNTLNISSVKTVGAPLDSFTQDFSFAVKKGNAALLSTLNEGLSLVIADGTFKRLYKKWFSSIETSVIKKSRIIVGGKSNYPPFEYIDAHGQPAGFNVELSQSIAKEMGLTITIQLDTWDNIVRKLRSGSIDVIQGMMYSPERDTLFSFSPAHSMLGQVIITRKNRDDPDTLQISDLHNKKGVVVKSDIMEEFAVKTGLQRSITAVGSFEEALNAVVSGRADYALVARIPAVYIINKQHLSTLHISSRALIATENCFSARKSDQELISLFSEGLKALENSGKYRKLYDKWLGVYDRPEVRFYDVIKYAMIIIVPISMLLLLSLLWSRMLSIKVTQRTSELRTEIIERKRIEAAVAAEKEQLAVTLRSIGEGVICVDNRSCVVIMNHIAELLCAETQNVISGRHLSEVLVVHSEDTDTPLDLSAGDVLNNGATIDIDHNAVLVNRNGKRFIVAISGAPIKGEDGTISGAVFVFRDLTERQKLINTIQRTTRLESLGALAGGIAHDFNNLMGGIFGYIDMAIGRTSQSSVTVPLEKALSTIDRARLLTNQLLTFAVGGEPVLKTDWLFPLVADTARFILSGSNINCKVSAAHDLKPCYFDKEQMRQVIEQLVLNAKQAMNSSGTITITAENRDIKPGNHQMLPGGAYIHLSIKDTGCGILPEHIPHLFDPFFTTRPNAHGLGLATCYSIVGRHHGMIEVASEPQRGSAFDIYLPVAPVGVQKTDAGLPADVFVPTAITHNGTGTVLVMDDEEIIREVIGVMLQSFGYSVVFADNGEDACTLFIKDLNDRQEITAMIFDLTVPGGVGGKEAVKKIRLHSCDIPVFVASGYSSDPVMAHPEVYGFSGSIGKPFNKQDLAFLFESTLGRTQQSTRNPDTRAVHHHPFS